MTFGVFFLSFQMRGVVSFRPQRFWSKLSPEGLIFCHNMSRTPRNRAPVAQLDRVHDYESCGRRFESFLARQLLP